MGLSEQLREGAQLIREIIPFTGEVLESASFGSTYVILGIELNEPCRIRFYDNEESANDSIEYTRSFGESTVSTDIALIADISVSQAGKYTLDPVLYGASEDTDNYYTYFTISDTTEEITGSLSVYKLDDVNIQADIENDFYKVSNRRQLEFIGNKNTLTSVSDGAPRTYLMLDAISDTDCRLRIYGKLETLNDVAEQSRSFSEAVMTPDLILLADMELVSGSITKFYPKIIGANLQTLPVNLETIRISRRAINSLSEIYYRLEPESSIVNMNIFSLED
jgi:hypothetical protein